MRFLFKASIPVEAGNKAAKEGRLAKIIESILGDLKPEAAYFLGDNGERTAYIFFQMEDGSEIPKVTETLDACVRCQHRDASGNGTRGSDESCALYR